MNRYRVLPALLAAVILYPSTGIAQTETPRSAPTRTPAQTPTAHASQSASIPARPEAAVLVGTWTLTAADVIKTDGTRTADYGPQPRGLAMFSANGHYMVAIYRAERLKFASNDNRRGTPEEYKDAAVTMSTHFGTYTVDPAKGTITLHITSGSFPNLDGTTQVRAFTLAGDELSWRVPPRPDGSVPVSVFKRVP